MGIFCSRNAIDTVLTEKSVIKKESPLAKQQHKMEIPHFSQTQTISSSSLHLPHPNAVTNTPQNSGRSVVRRNHSSTNLYLSPHHATIVYYIPKELQ